MGISAIGRALGYTRPTVRKYVQAGEKAGLVRGGQRRREVGWEELARSVVEQVAVIRSPGSASAEVARFHAYVAERIGRARLSVLYQRLRDERGLSASWGTFYRYVRWHWPERVSPAPQATVRLDDPPPGEEAQGAVKRMNPHLGCSS